MCHAHLLSCLTYSAHGEASFLHPDWIKCALFAPLARRGRASTPDGQGIGRTKGSVMGAAQMMSRRIGWIGALFLVVGCAAGGTGPKKDGGPGTGEPALDAGDDGS